MIFVYLFGVFAVLFVLRIDEKYRYGAPIWQEYLGMLILSVAWPFVVLQWIYSALRGKR